ncbi:MAG: hypothetical protein WB715_13210 [Roseiarcus sp.]|uniref:hypothetical protein n=1 Tax=Roseiarcus sp. TaxID=1969460 RepID=UPI003C409D96
MRLDQPSRHQTEEVEAPLFFVSRLMEGPLPSNRRLRLIERAGPLGELGLKCSNLGLESRCTRLIALRIRFPFSVKLLALIKVVNRVGAEFPY